MNKAQTKAVITHLKRLEMADIQVTIIRQDVKFDRYCVEVIIKRISERFMNRLNNICHLEKVKLYSIDVVSGRKLKIILL